MTSINEIQKINSIAKELLDHGMAGNRHDAVVLARKMMKSDESGDMFEQSVSAVPYKEKRPDKTDNLVEASSEAPSQESKPADNAEITQLASAIQKNSEFIAKKFNEFQKEIESLKGEVGHYRKEFIDLKSSIMFSKQNQLKQEEHSQVQQSASQEKQQETPADGQKARPVMLSKFEVKSEGKKSTTTHPRQGQYTPEDVALDKMFYYGTR